ncbi:MAG: hypothetical protein JNG90_11280, partial [Planctomycetaceae bacterium]|nr:hypothetical protein [Planctomycetaceae bacterium]
MPDRSRVDYPGYPAGRPTVSGQRCQAVWNGLFRVVVMLLLGASTALRGASLAADGGD